MEGVPERLSSVLVSKWTMLPESVMLIMPAFPHADTSFPSYLALNLSLDSLYSRRRSSSEENTFLLPNMLHDTDKATAAPNNTVNLIVLISIFPFRMKLFVVGTRQN